MVESWNVLYEFNLASEKYQGARSFGHRMRYEEFRFFYCVFVKKGKTRELAESLEDKKSIDVDTFKPRQLPMDHTCAKPIGAIHGSLKSSQNGFGMLLTTANLRSL